ncbi:L-rhamnose isomerase [termite gut metagenome]|uniref:L-rhamnose isomerase n=1 Tax=termite gut metagenome TaxID=433724 RepID=A0A5J4SL25_9ZZZZ
MKERIEKAYEAAAERYAEFGVDVEKALTTLQQISLSLQCWQADDVKGFENANGPLTGGIQATGNYPGRARNIKEAREDIEKALTMIPGKHRVSLHAIYGDFGGQKVERNRIELRHFQSWIDWAKERKLKLDFNSTSFSHPKSGDMTLSHRDKAIRDFWIEHTVCSRRIADAMGKQLDSKACHNLWVHDGSKDLTVDRYLYRQNLKDSLDTIFAVNLPDVKDALECKLFGTGLESFTVGSHEFYMGYAIQNGIMATLDMGHFHPTEETYDKIPSLLLYMPEILLHVSRPVRWDSDHVVILNDSLQLLAQEIVRANALNRTNIGLDYFDASINRIGAYAIGSRATQKAFLQALLEPIEQLRRYEANEQYFERLALLEEVKSLPWNAVYDYFCVQNETLPGERYIAEIQQYEKEVLSKR